MRLLAFFFVLFPFLLCAAQGKERLKKEVEKKLQYVTPLEEEAKITPVPQGIWRYLGNLTSIFGLFCLLGLAYLLSIHRKDFHWRLIGWGIGLQIFFALVILHTQPGKWVFQIAQEGVNHIIRFTDKGSAFVLGVLSQRRVLDETVDARIDVHIDSEGYVYVQGRKLTTGEYSQYLMSLSEKARRTAVPLSWPRDWKERWKHPREPHKRLNIPFEEAKKPIQGISYEQAYQYAKWKARSDYGPGGFIFVFQILTTIIFFSSLMAVLYHLGIMQKVVSGMAKLMSRTMGTSGAESLAVATNVFVGQTEAPLVVRPYVSKMTQSELMALMTGGFATIAGGVLVAYASFGIPVGHLLAASVMSAPAALVIAKIIVPEREHSLTSGTIELDVKPDSVNVIDAAASGASDGMKLALNVAAMLLAFIALIAMADALLQGIHHLHNSLLAAIGLSNYESLIPQSLSELFGILFAPLAFVMGISPRDTFSFASLIGIKIAVNEFVAYVSLKDFMPSGLIPKGNEITPRTFIIATYALCGFANFGSIAIQLGGIGGIAPERRHDLARLGLRAMLGGALASFMTATIAGILLSPKECDWRHAERLANRQIQLFLDSDETYALAEFAKPFFEYTAKYPGEDTEEVKAKVKNYLHQILTHYAQKGQQGRERAYFFTQVFQKRYPLFQEVLQQKLEEGKKDPSLRELVHFLESLK